MYCVCLKESGNYVTSIDCDGFTESSCVDYAIFIDNDLACMALIMFLCSASDLGFDDFYIQYFPEE